MDRLTYIWIVKAVLGQTQGIMGVFERVRDAERFAAEKYRTWTDDKKFTWKQGKTTQTVNITGHNQLKGHIIIAKYPVR